MMDGYAPYRATFVGGILDGRVLVVHSTAPGRLAPHGRTQPPYQFAWDGKPRPGAFDVYEIEGHDVGGDGTCTYNFVRTVR